MASAYNPSVPYNGFLTSQFVPGTRIEINGVVHGSSFVVNLKTASGAILLHFNPRFNESALVLNSNMRGSWEQEVRPPGFPFMRGAPFSLNMICEATGINVAVNGTPVVNFGHRGPFQEIKLVEITGDIQVHLFQEHPVSSFPSFGAPMMHGHGHHGHGHHQIPGAYGAPMMQGLPVPYQAPIVGGMQPGRQVLITGTMIGERFEVNLRCGAYEGGDIALHFNPRLNDRAVVRNTCSNGGWGAEERFGSFPFTQNAQFTIQIVCEYVGYKVFVNGALHSEYRHRIQPPQRVDTVQIKGSVALSSCTC